MSDETGAVTDKYGYGAYGESAGLSGNPYRFTGRRLDPETGLYYFRACYYSAALGRFMQNDPIGYQGGDNLYAYVLDDPFNFVDLYGTNTQVSVGANATLAFLFLGVGGNTNFGISMPDHLSNIGGYQVFVSVQGDGMFGGGIYAGYGSNIAVSSSRGAIPIAHASAGWYAEADAGTGPSVGGSVQGNISGVTGGGVSPTPKAGEGFGLWIGGGVNGNVTVATPTFGQIYGFAKMLFASSSDRVSNAEGVTLSAATSQDFVGASVGEASGGGLSLK